LCFYHSSTKEIVESLDAGAGVPFDLDVLEETLLGGETNNVEPSLASPTRADNIKNNATTNTTTRRRFSSFLRGKSFIPSRDGPPRHHQVTTITQSPGGTVTETPSDPDGSLYLSIWQNPDAVHYCNARPCGANNDEENQQESVDEVDSLFGSLSIAD